MSKELVTDPINGKAQIVLEKIVQGHLTGYIVQDTELSEGPLISCFINCHCCQQALHGQWAALRYSNKPGFTQLDQIAKLRSFLQEKLSALRKQS